MATGNQDATSTPFDLQSRIPDTPTSVPSMWPPVYAPPNGEQFREFCSKIDFENNPDADEMFAHPVPGPLRPRSPTPLALAATFPGDSLSRPSSPPLSPMRSEEYPSRSPSPELPLFRFEDCPPRRGTGLGKTARPPPRDVESTHTEGVTQASASRPDTPQSSSEPCETRPIKLKNLVRVDSGIESVGTTGIAVKVTSDMGPPPTPNHRDVTSARTGTATSYNENSSNLSPQRNTRLFDMDSPPRRNTLNVGPISAEIAAKVKAIPPNMGTPSTSKRKRLTESFPVSKRRFVLKNLAGPAVAADHRPEVANAVHRRVEELLRPRPDAMCRPLCYEEPEEEDDDDEEDEEEDLADYVQVPYSELDRQRLLSGGRDAMSEELHPDILHPSDLPRLPIVEMPPLRSPEMKRMQRAWWARCR